MIKTKNCPRCKKKSLYEFIDVSCIGCLSSFKFDSEEIVKYKFSEHGLGYFVEGSKSENVTYFVSDKKIYKRIEEFLPFDTYPWQNIYQEIISENLSPKQIILLFNKFKTLKCFL